MAPFHKSRRGLTILELLVAISITSVLLGLLAAGFHSTQQSARNVQRSAWLRSRRLGEFGPREQPIRVLFVGNSYTASNELPKILEAMANSVDVKPPLEVESITVGGARLKTHWDQGDAVDTIRDGGWDFVILQEQSQTPLKQFGRDQYFCPYARKFRREVEETDAITMFFMTWARPDMNLPQTPWTNSYLNIAKELRSEVAPVGMAWERILKSPSPPQLFADSGGHPSPTGTYIAACTFYAVIYNRSPVGLPSSVTTPGGTTVSVPSNLAEEIQEHIWAAVKHSKFRLSQN